MRQLVFGLVLAACAAPAFAQTLPSVQIYGQDTGTVTAVSVNASGQIAITCANCSGSGASHVDDAAFTVATNSVAPAGFLFDDVAPDSVNEGDAGIGRMSANRNIYVTLRDAAGNERGVNVDANGALAVTGSFSSGLADDADFTAGTTVFQPVGGFYQSTVTPCTDGDTCAAGLTPGRSLKVTITDDDGALVDYALDVTEDTAVAGGETGPPIMVERRDTPAASTSISGDWSTLHVGELGQLHTQNIAGAAGGGTAYNVASAASNNATNVKASAGNLYTLALVNTTSTLYYVRLYNLAASPTCSSATGYVTTLPVPASTSGAGVAVPIPVGIYFDTGIGYCITGGASSTDNTSAAAGIYGFVVYK